MNKMSSIIRKVKNYYKTTKNIDNLYVKDGQGDREKDSTSDLKP